MSVEADPPRRSSGLGTTLLWILLVLSIAANAFFVGAAWRIGSFVAQRPPSADMMLHPRGFMRELSPETRASVNAELRAHRGEFAQYFRELVASRKAVLDAMKAEPFDVGAYRQALEASAAVDGKARQQAIDFYVTVVQELTPAERQAVAARFEPRPWSRPRGGWGGRWRQQDQAPEPQVSSPPEPDRPPIP